MHVAPIAIRCEEIRASSATRTRIHWARGGASIPQAFSMAKAMATLLDMGEM